MEARPDSSRKIIIRVLEGITPVVTEEVSRVRTGGKFQDADSLWKKVWDSDSIEKAAKSLVKNGVDRMHVIYVYSRFRNSPAVGPPLIKWIVERDLTENEAARVPREKGT